MAETYKRLKGFADMFGAQSGIFTQMEDVARKVFFKYGFSELRTPILESTELFRRSIGAETDVVHKEMFTFEDSRGRSMSLRPEATAGVMRAIIEAGLDRDGSINKFYTLGPMFRHERPQKGRMRQFHQINCESLGSDSPYADAELVCMLMDFLSKLNIGGLALKYNSLGCRQCRPRYLESLKKFLHSLPKELFCADCQRRMDLNPLRVLDCKEEKCGNLIKNAPKFMDNLCPDCQAHHNKVIELLEKRGIVVELEPNLVRGLDYYTRTTFEVVSANIGSQTAVAGGGRYDGLVEQLGGASTPGIGFACGMERLALLMGSPREKAQDFYMLAMGQEDKAFALSEELRENGFSGSMNYKSASFKSLMRQASKSEAAFCLILGADEEVLGEITLKNMKTGVQRRISQAGIVEEFRKALAEYREDAALLDGERH